MSRGKTPQEAFTAARERAQHEHGHGGYTGTIAEKRSFRVLTAPAGTVNVCDWAQGLLDTGDPRLDDKWGPAGCVACGVQQWLFFGIASS